MLLSETSTTAKKEYSYDEYLRLNEVTETVLTDGKSFTFGYQYDSSGRLAKEIYPYATGEKENSTLNYVYDDYGYPVKKYLGTTLIWEAKEYAEQGQLSKYILGNNITVTKEFDNQGRLTNITGLKGSNTYQNMSYGYRGDGNMHFRTDATNSINKKEWFKYDTQNRLIGWETTSLNSSEPEYQTRISYEGNRISQKENIGNYGYSGFPHHGVKSSGVTTVNNSASGISYDHNMIDGRARVSSIISGNNSVTYTHGTSDELIKKTETKNGNTYTTYYAGGGKYELRIYNNNAETKLSYLGSGVVKYDTLGTTEDKILYLLKDHLGSVVKVLSINNNTITVEESFSYDVWGKRRNPTTWENTNITIPIYIYKGFTGHEHVEGFGLIHMKGRVYDPTLGLFLSPDPYVQSSTTMGFNRYSYCMGNPLMYTDPDGECVHLVIGAVVGGLFNWIANGAQFSWKGLGYFGIGALSGALSAGIGTGIQCVSAGASFSAGFVGSPGGIAAITSMAPEGALWSSATMAASAGASGLMLGSGNAWLSGASFGEGLTQGAIQGLIGGVSTGLLAGVSGGINAVMGGKDFWHGHLRKQTFNGRDYYFYKRESRAINKVMEINNRLETARYEAKDIMFKNRGYHIVADPVSAGNTATLSWNYLSEGGFLENTSYKVTSQTHYDFPEGRPNYGSVADAKLSQKWRIPVTHFSVTSDPINYRHGITIFSPNDTNLNNFILNFDNNYDNWFRLTKYDNYVKYFLK